MNVKYSEHRLKNGVRLITAPMNETKAVTILFLIGAGSRYEEARTNGVAHFLEHMFFKGTVNRPSTLEISKQLDALGADYNAFTGEEYTGFYVRVAGDDFREAFDIISDMLLNPLFMGEEIEREKGVIVEEINMYEDNPMRGIYDQAKILMYGDTPLGRNIAGKKGTVTKFTQKDFIQFREKFYRPDNLILTIAGAGDSATWKKQAEEKLAHLTGKADKKFVSGKVSQKKPQVRLVTKKTDQVHLVFGVHSFDREDKRRPILQVLENIMGGGMSSRLFTEVRERRGLAYYVKADTWDFRDAGAFICRAGVQVAKIDEAIQVIQDEFFRIADVPVTEEELSRSQKNLRGSMYLGLEDSMEIAHFLAEQELFWQKIDQPETIVNRWKKVKRDELQKVAKTLIQPSSLNLTIIGPYDDPRRFEKLLKH